MQKNQEKPKNEFPYEYDMGINSFKGVFGWSLTILIIIFLIKQFI